MNADTVIEAVCYAYQEITGNEVARDDVIGKTRKFDATRCRQVVLYILMEHDGTGPSRAGRAVNRDHATALYAHKQVAAKMSINEIEAGVVSLALQNILTHEEDVADMDTDDAIVDKPDSLISRLYRAEREKVKKLRALLDKERGTVARQRVELVALKAEYVKLAEESEEPDDWTPEQRKALAEYRERHMA